MKSVAIIVSLLVAGLLAHAEPLSAEQKAKVEKKLEALKEWGTDAKLVALVKAGNANKSEAEKAMTQDKWKAMTVFDPMLKMFLNNEIEALIKSKKGDDVSEAFVSRADGTKLAFLAKTTNWSHAGKPKHDLPMAGKTWIGEVEKDESTGKQQVQVSFPVLDGGKAIGSVVVGLALEKL